MTSLPAVQADIKWANERYAQAGIQIIVTEIKIVDPPQGVNLQNGPLGGSLDEYPSLPNLTAEEKALFDALGTTGTDDIIVFYVNALSAGSVGEQTRESGFPSDYAETKRLNNVIMAANRRIFTMPHEIMHVLLQDGSHDSETYRLMFSPTSLTNSVTATKRVSSAQAITMKTSKFVQ